jgi:hypothetical protein
MGYEDADVEAIPDMSNIVASRERFYIPVSLETHDIFCGDERQRADISDTSGGSHVTIISPEEHINWFGGGLNVAYNMTVMQETLQPDSVIDSFESRTASFVPLLMSVGVRVGVHSDVQSEQGTRVRTDVEGAVGCGYAEKRQQISQFIQECGKEIVADAIELRPELFCKPNDDEIAQAIVAAHGRLAERKDFFTNGRRVVLAAAAKGAKVMLVEGEHSATEGIINRVPHTSLHGDEAAKADLATYNHDSWAVEESNARMQHLYPHDRHQQQIAELIDTIGTMRLLGVEKIAVRRPASSAGVDA